jgi:hypothetical protein
MHHRDAVRRIKTEALWANHGSLGGRTVIDSNRRSTDRCSPTSCNDERFAAAARRSTAGTIRFAGRAAAGRHPAAGITEQGCEEQPQSYQIMEGAAAQAAQAENKASFGADLGAAIHGLHRDRYDLGYPSPLPCTVALSDGRAGPGLGAATGSRLSRCKKEKTARNAGRQDAGLAKISRR